MKWEPLITDEIIKQKIVGTINTISNELATNSSTQPSLIGANAGISIFWEYLSSYDNRRNVYHNNCVKSINSSLAAISDIPLSYNFSMGISGILWAYAHLVNDGCIQVNMDNLIGDEVHQFLLDSSKFDIQQNNYDYLHGGLSALPYFLERSNNIFCRKCAVEIIDELEKASENFPEGISWMEGFHFLSDNVKRYNLGMAHGMPSIIVLLSRTIEKGIAIEKCKKLLEGLVGWIIAQKQKDGVNGFFPTVMPSSPPYNSRVSWCYGDLGISIALFQAGLITNNNLWKEEAIMIAKIAATRVQPNAGAIDTCFCHGTVGNAHLFNRLYHYTGIEEFKDTALYWYEETFQFYATNGHFKFLKREKDGSNPRWEYEVGILEGTAGIGMSLIAAISDIEPKWDRCFLLS